MSTAVPSVPASPTAAPALANAALPRPGLRRGVAHGAHTGADFLSFTIISLLPLLAVRLDISTAEKALLLGVGSITSGFIQPLVAWLSDRLDTRALGTLGLTLAVFCVSAVGFAQNFHQLLVLHALSAAGVGAFHPPAAAAVGSLARPGRRSFDLAIFFVAGMVGGMGGNVLAPRFVDLMARLGGFGGSLNEAFGLRSLAVLVVPGVLMAFALGWAIHRVRHRSAGAHETHGALPARERSARWGVVWLLYFANFLRYATNLAMIYLFVEWSERLILLRTGAEAMSPALGLEASKLNGPLQATQQLGAAVGGLVVGAYFGRHPRLEKPMSIVVPIVCAVPAAALPFADRLQGTEYSALVVPLAMLCSVLSGVGFGALIPASVAAAQRMLPHRTGLASGLMMGGAWGIAFVGPKLAEGLQTGAMPIPLSGLEVPLPRVGIEGAFLAAAGGMALSGVLAVFLPARLLVGSRDER